MNFRPYSSQFPNLIRRSAIGAERSRHQFPPYKGIRVLGLVIEKGMLSTSHLDRYHIPVGLPSRKEPLHDHITHEFWAQEVVGYQRGHARQI